MKRTRTTTPPTPMQLLAEYKGWAIERNPAGLIIASSTDRAFPFIANSIEHAQACIDRRDAALLNEATR